MRSLWPWPVKRSTKALLHPLDDDQIVKAVEAHKWRPQYRQATSQAG